MKEFIEFLLKSLVRNPEAVRVDETGESGNFRYVLHVDQEDMGLVIGKEGRTINAIRSLAKARAVKEGIWVDIELADSGRMPVKNDTPSTEDQDA